MYWSIVIPYTFGGVVQEEIEPSIRRPTKDAMMRCSDSVVRAYNHNNNIITLFHFVLAVRGSHLPTRVASSAGKRREVKNRRNLHIILCIIIITHIIYIIFNPIFCHVAMLYKIIICIIHVSMHYTTLGTTTTTTRTPPHNIASIITPVYTYPCPVHILLL